MANLRDHTPVPIPAFGGLYDRGDKDNTPLNMFYDCQNIRFSGANQFSTRYGSDISQTVGVPLSNVKRIYNYPTPNGNTLIVLTFDNFTNLGSVYHFVNSTTVFGPILVINGMTDMAFIPYNGRAFISPFSTFTVNGQNIEKGLQNEVMYIYMGDGTQARPAAGAAPIASGVPPSGIITYNPPSVAPTLSVGSVYPSNLSYTPSINVTIQYTFIYSGGVESLPSSASSPAISLDGSHGWTANIPVGGAGVTGRKVYMTSTALGIVQTNSLLINDNITTIITNVTILSGNYVAYTSVPIFLYDPDASSLFTMQTGVNPPTTVPIIPPVPEGGLIIANGAPASMDAGFHLFGFVYEYDSGYITPPGAITGFTTVATNSVSFGNVPVLTMQQFVQGAPFIQLLNKEGEKEDEEIFPPINQPYAMMLLEETESEDEYIVTYPNSFYETVADPHVISRQLVATATITNYNGNPLGYDFFFVPDAIINNNTDEFLNNISFFDADLLEDATYLLNNYTTIPAGAVMALYHDRLLIAASFTDISLALISFIQQPEAISQITGLIVAPLDGNPITNAAELRDILYIHKRARTLSYADNGGEPATWPLLVIDNALGTSVHGIGTVLDSGSQSVDFLLVATLQGISLFNGKYITPELSFNIENFWRSLNQMNFNHIQILNAPITKEIYVILPDRTLLVGNYSNGMDPQNIRWTRQNFSYGVNTVAIWDINTIIVGADYLG